MKAVIKEVNSPPEILQALIVNIAFQMNHQNIKHFKNVVS